MGRFLLGSTVVLLFPSSMPGQCSLRFNPAWAPGQPIRLGQAMATRA
jgi:phosphatidylserine decarboxylase